MSSTTSKGHWDDEREPLFRELHYLLEWLEREDRRHGRLDRAPDWKTHVSPPEGLHVRVADHDRHDMHDGSAWARYLKQLGNRGGELPDNRGCCRSEPCAHPFYRCDSSCRCSSPALETDLRWCAVVIHGDALYYDRLILGTPAIGPGDRVLALAPDARRRLVCCDGSVPPPNYMRPAVVKSIDAAGSYMLTFDRSAPPSARAAFRDFVYGRVAVLELHKFKGYDDDDSDDSNVERGWVKTTHLYRSARRAIAACLEIAEADAHRVPPDEPEYLWIRYAPPTQFPLTVAERVEWEGFFDHVGDSKGAQFAKAAFEAQLPLFWCKRINDEYTVLTIEMRGLDEQVMTTQLVGLGTPNVRATTIPMRMDQITVSDEGEQWWEGWIGGPPLDPRYDGPHFKADYVYNFPARYGHTLVDVGNGIPPGS